MARSGEIFQRATAPLRSTSGSMPLRASAATSCIRSPNRSRQPLQVAGPIHLYGQRQRSGSLDLVEGQGEGMSVSSKSPVVARAVNPDIASAQPVAKFAQDTDFVGAGDPTPPWRSTRGRQIRRMKPVGTCAGRARWPVRFNSRTISMARNKPAAVRPPSELEGIKGVLVQTGGWLNSATVAQPLYRVPLASSRCFVASVTTRIKRPHPMWSSIASSRSPLASRAMMSARQPLASTRSRVRRSPAERAACSSLQPLRAAR